tara:strand:- start:2259 stop:3818 length:1560 start_codon:yes stop_codon:yes gene_type:complete
MRGALQVGVGAGVVLLLLANYRFRASSSPPIAPQHRRATPPARQSQPLPLPPPPPPPPLVPLFVYATFTDGLTFGEGMHLLTSTDAHAWRTLAGDPILFPQGRLGAVFRDPSIVWHSGWFHLVFTTELCVGLERLGFDCLWQTRTANSPPARFGYARSRDLVNWQDVAAVNVPLAGACNVWAPDWHVLTEREGKALGGGAIVVFSALVAPRCPPNFGPGARGHRNRPYYMATSDFKAFSAPRLLFEPTESAIDATLFRVPQQTAAAAAAAAASSSSSPSAGLTPGALFAIYKSEQNECARWRWDAGGALWANRTCTLALRLARAPSGVQGPFVPVALGQTPFWDDALSRPCVEGPTVLWLKGSCLVLFDSYRPDCPLFTHAPPPCARVPGLALIAQTPSCAYQSTRGLGALRSDNLRDWRDVSDDVRAPAHHKHGTALRLTRDALCSICAAMADASSSNRSSGGGGGGGGGSGSGSGSGAALWRSVGLPQHCAAQQPPCAASRQLLRGGAVGRPRLRSV